MAFDVTIIKFTAGTREGEYGILIDRKLDVFAVYDCDGEFLMTWEACEAVQVEDNDQIDNELLPLVRWLREHPFRMWGSHKDDLNGVPPSLLTALARVADEMADSVDQKAVCLADNLCRDKVRNPSIPRKFMRLVILSDGETFGDAEGAVLFEVDVNTLSQDARDDLENGSIESAFEEVGEGPAEGVITPLH